MVDHVHGDAFAHEGNETRVVEGCGEEGGGVTTVDGHFKGVTDSDWVEMKQR